MALFGLGKRFRNRTFEYVPRYYDEGKEDLDRRLGKNDADTPDAVKLRIRSGFQKKYRVDSRVTSSANKASNMRLLVIVILLIVITGLLLMEFVPSLVKNLEQ